MLESSLFMLGLSGPELTPEEKEAIKALGLKHFILFKRNIVDQGQLRALIGDLRALAPEGFLAVDQEGGRVVRLVPPLFPPLPAPLELASSPRAEERVRQTAKDCAQRLKALGFNFNLAPVLDLGGEDAPDFLRGRTFGEDPAHVARLGQAYIKAFLEERVLCCAKHFPGLGGARIDPHEALPFLPTLREEALLPFAKAVEAGVPAVMTTHLVVEELHHQPATFSRKVVRLLRERLSFQGLVLSDDLFMGAVSRSLPLEEALLQALAAGHDLLLLCEDFARSVAAVEQALPLLRETPFQGLLQGALIRQKKALSIAS